MLEEEREVRGAQKRARGVVQENLEECVLDTLRSVVYWTDCPPRTLFRSCNARWLRVWPNRLDALPSPSHGIKSLELLTCSNFARCCGVLVCRRSDAAGTQERHGHGRARRSYGVITRGARLQSAVLGGRRAGRNLTRGLVGGCSHTARDMVLTTHPIAPRSGRCMQVTGEGKLLE